MSLNSFPEVVVSTDTLHRDSLSSKSGTPHQDVPNAPWPPQGSCGTGVASQIGLLVERTAACCHRWWEVHEPRSGTNDNDETPPGQPRSGWSDGVPVGWS